jgi:hypothetical protein
MLALSRLVLAIIVVNTSVTSAVGQDYKFWGPLKSGNYLVSYRDTIIYKSDEQYTYLDYKGPKPFVLGIWAPSEAEMKGESLTLQSYFDLFSRTGKAAPAIAKLRELELNLLAKEVGVNRATHERDTTITAENLLVRTLLATRCNARLKLSNPSGKYPVVIYHHGSGSIRQDNTVLFEFLASHGYVVISSNFHLPLSGSNDLENFYGGKKFNPVTDALFVTDFASKLPYVNAGQMYWSGHSWGAGVGLALNQQMKHPFKKFILLESTLEDYTFEQINEMMPGRDSIFRHHAKDFITPTWLVSAARDYYEEGKYVRLPDPEFVIFKKMPAITKICSRVPMHHDTFVSIGPMKNVYAQEFYQSDALYNTRELDTYYGVVKFVLDGLKGRAPDEKRFYVLK